MANKRNLIDLILWTLIVIGIIIMFVCYWTYQEWLDSKDLKQEIVNLKASIKQHQDNHNQAWIEKESCKKSCEESWDKQAEDEHKAADEDRAKLKEIENTLGLWESSQAL